MFFSIFFDTDTEDSQKDRWVGWHAAKGLGQNWIQVAARRNKPRVEGLTAYKSRNQVSYGILLIADPPEEWAGNIWQSVCGLILFFHYPKSLVLLSSSNRFPGFQSYNSSLHVNSALLLLLYLPELLHWSVAITQVRPLKVPCCTVCSSKMYIIQSSKLRAGPIVDQTTHFCIIDALSPQTVVLVTADRKHIINLSVSRCSQLQCRPQLFNIKTLLPSYFST